MRRNVRRLNREIGNVGSNLSASSKVSLPLALPTSYQPRSLEKRIISNLKDNVGTEDPSAHLQSTLPALDIHLQSAILPVHQMDAASVSSSSTNEIPTQSAVVNNNGMEVN
jgi:hypothetical protein